MSRKWKMPLDVTLQPEEGAVVMMLLRERARKLERERLKAETRGEPQHSVSVRAARRVNNAIRKFEAALAANKRSLDNVR